jgi:hypothetical protein
MMSYVLCSTGTPSYMSSPTLPAHVQILLHIGSLISLREAEEARHEPNADLFVMSFVARKRGCDKGREANDAKSVASRLEYHTGRSIITHQSCQRSPPILQNSKREPEALHQRLYFELDWIGLERIGTDRIDTNTKIRNNESS